MADDRVLNAQQQMKLRDMWSDKIISTEQINGNFNSHTFAEQSLLEKLKIDVDTRLITKDGKLIECMKCHEPVDKLCVNLKTGKPYYFCGCQNNSENDTTNIDITDKKSLNDNSNLVHQYNLLTNSPIARLKSVPEAHKLKAYLDDESNNRRYLPCDMEESSYLFNNRASRPLTPLRKIESKPFKSHYELMITVLLIVILVTSVLYISEFLLEFAFNLAVILIIIVSHFYYRRVILLDFLTDHLSACNNVFCRLKKL
ncbi:hypothetical protein GJ496_008318 [Pomphorhynchus laevis]|nr:hypothetical protein GJ496_008318 [Pomphorhynchus laevis]